MPAARDPVRNLALFDLDGTLTYHDTLFFFLTGYLSQHPARLARTWRIVPALGDYALRGHDRGRLKSQAIRAVLGGLRRPAVEAWARQFVALIEPRHRLRPDGLATLERHRQAGDRLVLLSASPDLYVPLIGKTLHFDHTICTELRWDADRLHGALVTENRRGEEKVRCLERLRAEWPNASITAYGNSASDVPHLARADRALLVNGNAAARRLAAQANIPVGDWR
jgi:phosphatidylglycerophosphatase C